MRDLVRARTAAMEAVRRARQQLQGFLLRHGRVFTGRTAWTPGAPPLAGRAPLRAPGPADRAGGVDRRRSRRPSAGATAWTQQIGRRRRTGRWRPWSRPCRRCAASPSCRAVTLVAELGDLRRFANPRQLMAYLGLVPSEHSSGARVRRGGITKAGNGRARRVLVEGAWSYRFPARVTGETPGPAGGGARGGAGDRLEGAAPARAPATAASWPAARTRTWSPPRSPARWRPSPGRSPARSSPRVPPPEPITTGTTSEENDTAHPRRTGSRMTGGGARRGTLVDPLCDRSPTSAPRPRQPRDEPGPAVANPRIRV